MSISPFSTAGLPTTLPTTMLNPTAAVNASVSNFASTGVAGMGGGYAYPPGSSMTSFMDNINNTVAAASKGPNGGSIEDWANGLAAQAAQRKALAAATAASTLGSAMGTGASGTPNISQMMQMLMSTLGGTAPSTGAAAGNAGTATGGSTNISQMLQMLLSMLSSLKGTQ